MKQYITKTQSNELSKKGKTTLIKWHHDKSLMINPPNVVPLLSIGQMIEFIYQHATVIVESEERMSPWQGWDLNKGQYKELELVDALWEWVKDILERGEER